MCDAFYWVDFIFFSLSTFAGGYFLPEQASPAIGTANVGRAAFANDASTAYFNPAGMTQLNRSQVLLGTQVLLPNLQFKTNDQTTFAGGNGGQAGSLTPGAAIYSTSHWKNSPLFIGLSVTSPFGGMISYTDGWAGRYYIQDSTFLALNLNPAFGYKINKWLSIGAGFSLEYANLKQTNAIPRPNAPLDDGQIHIKTDNYAGGFNLGLLIKTPSSTRLGLAYRSEIKHRLQGKTFFLRLDTIPNVKSEILSPQTLLLSIYQPLSPKLALVGEISFENWHILKRSFVQIDNFTFNVPLRWQDTYHLGAGLEYQIKPQLTVQTGFSYDSSPTKTSLRVPSLAIDQQYRLGSGIIYQTKQGTRMGLQGEYVYYGKAAMHQESSLGTFAGDFGNNNYALIVAMNINCLL